MGRVLEVGGMMNLRHISLLQIDSFLAVCKHLNFTEAAKSLYISQPSLSKQIAAFENEIGVQLFLRNKRAVRLTAAGAVLFKELGDITQQISDAIEKAREPNLGQEGTLVIGCLNGMDTDRFLPKILEDFTANHPKVNLIFERHSFKDLRERLLSGAIDIMFTLSFEMDETLDLEWEDLHDNRYEEYRYPHLRQPAELSSLGLLQYLDHLFSIEFYSNHSSPNLSVSSYAVRPSVASYKSVVFNSLLFCLYFIN